MLSLAVTLLATVAGPGHTDSTLAVTPGSRLDISNFRGQVHVSAWGRNSVRVEADHGRRTHVGFILDGRTLKLESSGDRGVPSTVTYDISAPAWMPLVISGPMTDVDIEGSEGPVKVETVNGQISVDGGRDYVELSSVQGGIEVRGAKGRLKLSSINESVTATDVTGQIEVETVNGEVILDRVTLDALTASSVAGDLWFNGTLQPGGRYHLESHSGNIQMVVADRPDASLSVSTFSGEFSSDFELAIHGENRRERMQFTLGHGGSDVSLESFDGNIQLLKSSQVEALRARIRADSPARPDAPEAPTPAAQPRPSKAPRPANAPKPPGGIGS